MENLDKLFKYKIGDVVALKAQSMIAEIDDKKFQKQRCQLMQIVKRLVVECAGGIQTFYLVRISSPTVGYIQTLRDLWRFTELELIPYTKEKSKA